MRERNGILSSDCVRIVIYHIDGFLLWKFIPIKYPLRTGVERLLGLLFRYKKCHYFIEALCTSSIFFRWFVYLDGSWGTSDGILVPLRSTTPFARQPLCFCSTSTSSVRIHFLESNLVRVLLLEFFTSPGNKIIALHHVSKMESRRTFHLKKEFHLPTFLQRNVCFSFSRYASLICRKSNLLPVTRLIKWNLLIISFDTWKIRWICFN